ncbi:MAG: hypothetical protein HZRFUVUK_001123 [Candidatus Fervidibacterota bacterium]|jgi:acetolactate synthase-1/2/3 large subunit
MGIKAAEALVQTLIDEGVEIIFGIPGGAVLEIFDALYHYRDQIKFVLARHEQGAAHEADGYARATGRVGVCMATSGPGSTNLTTGLAAAMMDSSAVVAITGQVATPFIGKDAFQETDTTGITMPITKHNFLVMDARELPRIIKEAFYIAKTGRRGPVVVDIPRNISRTELDDDFQIPKGVSLRSYKVTLRGHPLMVRRAAELIASCSRPTLYIGGGVIASEASEEVKELAERCHIPVVYTLMAKGAFPDGHELCLGMGGMHGTVAANMALNTCDLLICVGARFDDRITGNPNEFAKVAKKIHIDIDPAEIGKNVKVDVPIVGDAKIVLQQLLEIVQPKRHDSWIEKVMEWKRNYPLTYKQSSELLKPQFVVETVAKLTGGSALVVTDVGQNQMWAAQYYPCYRPRQFISSGGLGTMGFGFPASIGAQFGRPDELVVAFVGDGGFQMTMYELATAVLHKLPIKVIIFNNSFLGMVKQWQDIFFGGRYSATTLYGNPDFVKVAEAYGAVGMRVKTPDELQPALEKALEVKDKPCIIDCCIDPDEHVYPMIPAGGTIKDIILPPEQRHKKEELLADIATAYTAV